MYGVPVDLSADQYVSLALNLPRARMWGVYQGVIAAEIASGNAGPIEYYDLFSGGDRARASDMMGDQVLRGMMRR